MHGEDPDRVLVLPFTHLHRNTGEQVKVGKEVPERSLPGDGFVVLRDPGERIEQEQVLAVLFTECPLVEVRGIPQELIDELPQGDPVFLFDEMLERTGNPFDQVCLVRHDIRRCLHGFKHAVIPLLPPGHLPCSRIDLLDYRLRDPVHLLDPV